MLNDDIGTARRMQDERERLAAQRQLQHEARTVYPSRIALVLARFSAALRSRRRLRAPEAEPRPVRVRPARRSPNR